MKKFLSIILAILMVVTTIPFAFAADETLDFSDAKVLTANEKGILCIDGVQVEYDTYTVTSTYFMYYQYLPSGKYKLSGDVTMHKNGFIFIEEGENVSVDLNGYTWNCNDCTYTDGTFSVYDTSKDEKGKITSAYGQILVRGDGEFNLYSGTIEDSKGGAVLRVVEGTANLYGGKLKSNEYIIEHILYENAKINLGGTVLENEEGYPEIESFLSSKVPQGVINVADYTGESLTVEIDADYAGKIKILEGVENAQEAEKYTIKFYKNDFYYLDKTEYNEETGEMFAYTAKYAFTQQPSAENGYTVDFNNPDATFQWYEVEETILTPDNVTAIEEEIFENEKWLHGGGYVEFFTVDANAGDMITASTTSDCSFDLNVFTEDYSIDEIVRTTGKASVTIDSDAEVIVGIFVDGTNETTEFEIELIKISEMDETETDKTLQNPECGKTYVCKTSVGENVYLSDVVTVGHNIVSVDAKAPTCTEIGWDAYEYCTVCDFTTKVELPVDPDAHDWSNKDGVCAYGCGTVCDHAGQTGYACAICGVELHTCDFTGEWKYDSEKHWKECECGEVTESAHVYTDGVCDVCGYECLHENWTDGTCDACGYDCEHAFDTDANIMTALTCERCGYTYKSDERWAEGVYETYYNGLVAMLNSYYYDDDEIVAYFALDTVDGEESSISFDWAINQGFTEYGEFSLHFYHNGKEVITHDFSSTANPYDNILSEEYKFTAEGETQIFKFVFKKDDFGYWYDDGRTAYLNIKDHSHVFGEATCIAKAVCETCGEEYGDIDADNHDIIIDEAVAPDCANTGLTQGEHCTRCDYKVEQEIVPALNHKDTLVQVDAKAPTCTEIGWDAYEYCIACDYTTYVEIPVDPDAHDIIIDKAVAPNCANTGLTEGQHCSRCNNATIAQEVIPALNHKDTLVQVDAKAPTCTEIGWDAYEYCTACTYTTYVEKEALNHRDTLVQVEAKAPSCTEIGWDAYEYCSACDYTTYVEIPENGHTPLDAVRENEVASKCGLAGSYDLVVYCDCGEELDRDKFTVEALKHSFTKYEVTEEAKCGVEGKEVAYCDNGCGETDEKAIEALKHSFTKYEVAEEAKCGVEGKEVAYCDHGCGETDEKAIEALEHLFLDYIYNEDATCTADGTKTAECIYGCGETDTVTAEDTMLNHADEDGDKICDDCETEIKDVCPDCGGPAHEETGVPQYICMLITLIKLVVSLVKALQSVA